MFAMAAIKGETYTWALWAPGFYYELKQRTGVTQSEAGAQMNALNAQLIGQANATITRAQANEIKAMCLAGQQ
jgi:long-subunit fatty acid transport protein